MDVEDEGTVVCFSGGIDSTVVLLDMFQAHGPEKVVAMGANYGQPHKHELAVGAAFCKSRGIPYEEVPISFSLSGCAGRREALSPGEAEVFYDAQRREGKVHRDHRDIVGRNLHIVAAASVVAHHHGFGKIAMGCNLEDGQGEDSHDKDSVRGGFQDCTESYFKALSIALQYGGGPRIITPLINMTKKEVVQRAVMLGIDLNKTWSCFFPQWIMGGPPEVCGVCGACISTQEATEGVQHQRESVEGVGDKA
jgi:7-cyano-7-deazaguanine synthase